MVTSYIENIRPGYNFDEAVKRGGTYYFQPVYGSNQIIAFFEPGFLNWFACYSGENKFSNIRENDESYRDCIFYEIDVEVIGKMR